jgi:hypothetical protein
MSEYLGKSGKYTGLGDFFEATFMGFGSGDCVDEAVRI